MELDVCDYLLDFLRQARAQVDHVVRDNVVLQIPQIDAKVIRRNKIFAVRTCTKTVDRVVVAVFELFALHALLHLTHGVGLGENNLAVLDIGLAHLLALLVLQAPQFNNFLVC